MNANELVCECGHEIHNGRCYYWECKPGHEDCYNCPCEEFTDVRLAALRAENERLQGEIARLTPTETSAPPTKPGWYWRVNDEIDEWQVVHVREDLDGRLYIESRDDDGTVVINLVLHGERWSKEPMPMPVIEKEGK